MDIDPVIVLADELHATERALQKAVKLYEGDPCQENGESVNAILACLKNVHRKFYYTVPTSALGASELIGLVAQRLPLAHADWAKQFREIAARLALGKRAHGDLVWLRSARSALSAGMCAQMGIRAAPLLELAIIGAARPVVVYRTFKRPLADTPDKDKRVIRLC